MQVRVKLMGAATAAVFGWLCAATALAQPAPSWPSQPIKVIVGYTPGTMPESEAAASETLALPIYPELTEEQIRYVANTVTEFTNA